MGWVGLHWVGSGFWVLRLVGMVVFWIGLCWVCWFLVKFGLVGLVRFGVGWGGGVLIWVVWWLGFGLAGLVGFWVGKVWLGWLGFGLGWLVGKEQQYRCFIF